MVVRSPVSRIKARAEGGFGGGSDESTTNALWNALTERCLLYTSDAADE